MKKIKWNMRGKREKYAQLYFLETNSRREFIFPQNPYVRLIGWLVGWWSEGWSVGLRWFACHNFLKLTMLLSKHLFLTTIFPVLFVCYVMMLWSWSCLNPWNIFQRWRIEENPLCYRVFIKYCAFVEDFKIFRTLTLLCFP